MAKSLRSKRKRKVRAEKRIVNAKKELVKLKEVAAKLHGTKDGVKALESSIPDIQVSETPMLVDAEHSSKVKGTRVDNRWMNQRRIKAIKNKIKQHNKKKARRGNSAGLSSRRTKRSVKR